MGINIGNIHVCPEGTTNPYKVEWDSGNARSEALRKWFMGEPTPGLEFWYAPACGGARKLSGPEETDVDADQVENIWGQRSGRGRARRRLTLKERHEQRSKGLCMNGCDKPICPPSKVVCRDCLDVMGEELSAMLLRMEGH